MALAGGQGGFMEKKVEDRPDVAATAMEELEEKSKDTMFKIMSVTVYVCAVGGNGFLLSVFFLFMWDSGISVERPEGIPPDYGWLGGLRGDRYTADDIPFPQSLKDPQLPISPYRRIMSSDFTTKFLDSYLAKNGGHSDIPEAPRALPLQAAQEYDNKGSTVEPASNSPRVTRSTNMNDYNMGYAEEGIDRASSSDGGPMAKPEMRGSAITSH